MSQETIAHDCQLLSVEDLARLLKLSPRSLWRMAALSEAGQGDGFPAPIRVGPRLRRWRLRDVQSYLDAGGNN